MTDKKGEQHDCEHDFVLGPESICPKNKNTCVDRIRNARALGERGITFGTDD
jgi:hypothetical protein